MPRVTSAGYLIAWSDAPEDIIVPDETASERHMRSWYVLKRMQAGTYANAIRDSLKAMFSSRGCLYE